MRVRRKLVYLTFKEMPSGVYRGQVVDVVRLWEQEGITANLVSMVWPNVEKDVREELESLVQNCMVLRIQGGRCDWKRNRFRLAMALLRLGPCSVVARSPLAANLALDCRNLRIVNRVCYDGRAAAAAELEEYSSGHELENLMPKIECRAVLKSDYRIAVSEKLVNYWSDRYGYDSKGHVVIPCSTGEAFVNVNVSCARLKRKALGFAEDDVVFVYAGAGQGWQSEELLDIAARNLISRNRKNKLLLLSQSAFALNLEREFSARVVVRWVDSERVPEFLAAGDYGLLLRELTITNQVAAPVKFAEYLSCGLPVICSSCIGDYPDFVNQHEAGYVIDGRVDNLPNLKPVLFQEKLRLQQLGAEWFSKKSDRILNGYRKVAEKLV